ncbi:sigma-54-dependent transcriptional regulator [Desulforhopalus sp. 52FAK]
MKLLIIDDEENMCHMLKAMIERHGYDVTTAFDGLSAIERITEEYFEFILCDVKMPQMDGMTFLEKGAAKLKDSTVIMMSAFGTVDLAIAAMKAGAYDFISKPFKTDEVLLTLRKAEEREYLKKENRQLKNELDQIKKSASSFGKMVARSHVMEKLFELIKKTACYSTTVLITGESGTGKELVARAIHDNSMRKDKPFVAVNCGSIPGNLIESELFGYVRGAFTGAERNRRGLFEEADGATLFLDEIGELPLGMQVKLLRVLQEQEIRPIGSRINKKVDCRIIAATARELGQRVSEGVFREDLFYRLNVMPLKVPPVRERKDDILLLCEHFINTFNVQLNKNIKGLTSEAAMMILDYSWPGNVRELENTIQRGMILTMSDFIDTDQLSNKIRDCSNTNQVIEVQNHKDLSLKRAQVKLEKEFIELALRKCDGNKSKAALMLEISYPSLFNKIKAYNL